MPTFLTIVLGMGATLAISMTKNTDATAQQKRIFGGAATAMILAMIALTIFTEPTGGQR